MSTKELYDMASVPNVSAKDFMAQAEEFMRVSALEDGETDPNELVNALWMADRYDILETIKEHPVYGERATQEITIKNMMDSAKLAHEAEVEKYPPIFKEWVAVLRGTSKIGIYDVSYPSRHALSCGLSDNHVAISGDGLFMFMFEVMSLEGRGLFKIVKRPIDPNRPQSESDKKYGEGSDSDAFRAFGNWEFGNIITGDDVLNGLKAIYP